MAKASTRKLKVFQTRIGFYDIVIATPSRAAALRGFGVSQDLFHQGLASEATEPDVIEAALAQPGTPLRRPAGSDGAFKVDPARPKIADLTADDDDDDTPPPEPARRKKAAPATPAEPPPRSKPRLVPDRRALAAAEAELKAIEKAEEEDSGERAREEEALKAEEAQLRARRAALEAEEIRLRTKRTAHESEAEAKQRDWEKKRAKAQQAVERERRAYRLSGGEED